MISEDNFLLSGEKIVCRIGAILDKGFGDYDAFERILTNMRYVIRYLEPELIYRFYSFELDDFERPELDLDNKRVVFFKKNTGDLNHVTFTDVGKAKQYYDSLCSVIARPDLVITGILKNNEERVYKYMHSIDVIEPLVLPRFHFEGYDHTSARGSVFAARATIVPEADIRLCVTNESLVLYELDVGWRIIITPNAPHGILESHSYHIGQPQIHYVKFRFDDIQVSFKPHKRFGPEPYLQVTLTKGFCKTYHPYQNEIKSIGETNTFKICTHKKETLREVLDVLPSSCLDSSP